MADNKTIAQLDTHTTVGGTENVLIESASTAKKLSVSNLLGASLWAMRSLGASGKFLYTTALNTWAEADITAAGRALLDDANAAAQRTTLGLAIGTDVQAELDVPSQAEAEAGTATTERVWTAQRVKQAIAALETQPGPAFSAHRNGTDQTGITISTFTKVQLTTEDFDTDSDFDNATNYRFTPSVAGKYLISGAAMLQGLADQAKATASIYKNGAEHKRIGDVQQSDAGGASVQVTGSALVEANGTTDYFELFVLHDSAGTIDVEGTASQTFFQGHFVRA